MLHKIFENHSLLYHNNQFLPPFLKMHLKRTTIAVFAALALSISGFSQTALNNSLDSLSYAIGVNIGQSLKQQGVQPNTEIIGKAIKDFLAEGQLAMQPEACNSYIQSYFQNQYMAKAEANRSVSEAYLAANKEKPDVLSLPSGLQYKILKAGEGAKPTTESKVKVHYEGKTIDGNVFDSSLQRGTPAEFGVTQVIKGWTEALQLMSVGSVWELYIPAELAYGAQGPPAIGPNQALIFEVQLLEILP